MSFIVNESTGNPLKTSQILRGLCNGKKRINDKIPEKKKKKKKTCGFYLIVHCSCQYTCCDSQVRSSAW